jgi:hypothetical protein
VYQRQTSDDQGEQHEAGHSYSRHEQPQTLLLACLLFDLRPFRAVVLGQKGRVHFYGLTKRPNKPEMRRETCIHFALSNVLAGQTKNLANISIVLKLAVKVARLKIKKDVQKSRQVATDKSAWDSNFSGIHLFGGTCLEVGLRIDCDGYRWLGLVVHTKRLSSGLPN